MKTSLDKIEARLQSLVEGGVVRLFPLTKNPQELMSQLVSEMIENVHHQDGGVLWAPNTFTMILHPAQAQLLLKNQVFLDRLASALHQAGDEAGFIFPSYPVIEVEADSEMGVQETQVVARYNLEALVDTSTMKAKTGFESRELPLNAFLIVDGAHVFPLEKIVLNIGRGIENHLVIEDLRVSRVHAQLRAIKGRFAIFDLDSTGGTFVNGQQIHQMLLYPGDVISLAGIPLVYGQDSPYQGGETQEMTPEGP